MKSALRGKPTSAVEVANVTPNGFWLSIRDREVFVSFKDFAWFREASIGQLCNVELPSPHHLHWPELDVDLAVDSLEHPECYPLVSRARPNKRLEPTTGAPVRRGHRSRTSSARRGSAGGR